MEKVSSFLIQKTIDTQIGQVTDIKRSRNGKILLQTKTSKQAENILKITSLGNIVLVKVIEHPTLNLCRQIIYCYDLKYLEDSGILDNLKTQKVIALRHTEKGK